MRERDIERRKTEVMAEGDSLGWIRRVVYIYLCEVREMNRNRYELEHEPVFLVRC